MTKTVKYSCPFVPCELIAAYGLRPEKLVPTSAAHDATGAAEGLCAYARAFVNSVWGDKDADAVVVATICDQMRRAPELIARVSSVPVFLLNVPTTWQSEASGELYVAELHRLGKFLSGLGGEAPSKTRLAEVMLEYEAHRRERQADDRTPARAAGIPLAIVGGEMRREDLDILAVIESAGGQIVLDATDSGERALPAPFDRRQVRTEPLQALADAYFGSIPHAFRRPDSQLYGYLKTQLAARDVRGIVFRRYQWCDIWNAESQRLREWTDIPVLDLDFGSEGADRAGVVNRIQAFVEMLR